jgi:hypothetical protein
LKAQASPFNRAKAKFKWFLIHKKIRLQRETGFPWSLHIRSFWKTHFINPPEVHGQVVRLLIYGKVNCDAKVSKLPIWVNMKIAEYVPLYAPGQNFRNEKYIRTS